MLAVGVFAVALAGCARAQPPPPVAPSSAAVMQQQLFQLTWLNATLQQALRQKEAELAAASRGAGGDTASMRTLLSVNGELAHRLEAAQRALQEAAFSDEERRALEREVERLRGECGGQLPPESLFEMVDVLQRHLDTGVVRVRMHDGRAQLLARPKVSFSRDPWSNR